MIKRKKLFIIFSGLSVIVGFILLVHPYLPQLYFKFVDTESNEISYYVSEPEKLALDIPTNTGKKTESNILKTSVSSSSLKARRAEEDADTATVITELEPSNIEDTSVSEELVDIYYPAENRLVIPQLGVDAEILESETLDILWNHSGVWHEPETFNPDTGGNMVIAGHRFQYRPPNNTTFYNLHHLEYGDRFIVYWNQKDYIFEVTEKIVVSPVETSVRWSDPEKSEVTLYSCDPIGSTKNRLIVKAQLI
ncbi:MAG: sortase [bacterium]|nr:sortase [bacterium]